jgi:hypothetical protein
MIPGWYHHNEFDICEYFISKDGWCIAQVIAGPINNIVINKYKNLNNFTAVKNKKIILKKNRFLLKRLFRYGWGANYTNREYNGDFFK